MQQTAGEREGATDMLVEGEGHSTTYDLGKTGERDLCRGASEEDGM